MELTSGPTVPPPTTQRQISNKVLLLWKKNVLNETGFWIFAKNRIIKTKIKTTDNHFTMEKIYSWSGTYNQQTCAEHTQNIKVKVTLTSTSSILAKHLSSVLLFKLCFEMIHFYPLKRMGVCKQATHAKCFLEASDLWVTH